MKQQVKILLVAFSIFTILFFLPCFSKQNNSDIDKKVAYLEHIIKNSFQTNSEITKLNSEWAFFTLTYSSYAFCNIAMGDSSVKPKAIELIDLSIQRATKSDFTFNFTRQNEVNKEAVKNGSVLYLGHINLMMGCYKLLSGKSKYDSFNILISDALEKRFQESPSKHLESYIDQIWIPDNTVALASLYLGYLNFDKPYNLICEEWVKHAKENLIEEKSQVLCSMVDPETGECTEEARGSMLGWSIFFVSKFDYKFGKELYTNYKKNFSNNLICYRFFRERYHKWTIGIGDFDSGPLIFGYSIPANMFALGNAQFFDDKKTVKKIKRLIWWGAKELEDENQIYYKTRFIDLKISPLAEAIYLFSETNCKWN